MLLGVMGDIHGNYEALRAIWDRLEQEHCARIVCLGDIVGYGAKPNECVQFLRDRPVECLCGNHDHYVLSANFLEEHKDIREHAAKSLLWTRNALKEENIHWLQKLPMHLEIDDMIFLHASLACDPPEYWPYILDVKSAGYHFFNQKQKISFCGHSHIPVMLSFNEKTYRVSISIHLEKIMIDRSLDSVKYMVNPGAVGQPRNGDPRASAGVFNTESGEFRQLTAAYDIAMTQAQILSAGLPDFLAERLKLGR